MRTTTRRLLSGFAAFLASVVCTNPVKATEARDISQLHLAAIDVQAAAWST